MNREHLDLLLRLGLITQARYAAAVTGLSVNGSVPSPSIDLHVAAVTVTCDVEQDDEGNPTGGVVRAETITRYDELIESHGMVIHSGALEPRQPLVRNKMLRDHNHAEPVGYLLEVGTDGQAASWQIASTEIARVQQEIDEHLRDGLSVGFTAHEYEIDDDWIIHVYRADWYETSLCAIPAVQEAGVTSVAAALAAARKETHVMNRKQLAAALAAGTITQEQHDAALAALEATEAAPAPRLATPPTPPEVEAGPTLSEEPAPTATVVSETLSVREVTQRLTQAVNTGDRSAVALAISDIVPADDAGTAFVNRDDWQGELFTANDPTRPWIDAFGTPQSLTSIKGKGWRWTDEPDVDEYSGNKTEVPSNEIGTESAEFTAFRIAAGWDIDRIFEDLADAEFWTPFWSAVMRSYTRKSNAAIRTRVLASCLTPGATLGGTETVAAGGVLALLKQVIRDVRAVEGGRANRVFLADDQFALLEDVPTDDLPLWLKSATIGLDIASGTSDVGQLRIVNDSTLDDGQVAAFDSRSGVVRERAPFQVQALNIPNGGIDVGIFSYLRWEPNDTRLMVTRTYGEELPTE